MGCISHLRRDRMKSKYIIKTNSKLLAEFAKSPEGVAKILLIVTAPFWGIAYLVRKCAH